MPAAVRAVQSKPDSSRSARQWASQAWIWPSWRLPTHSSSTGRASATGARADSSSPPELLAQVGVEAGPGLAQGEEVGEDAVLRRCRAWAGGRRPPSVTGDAVSSSSRRPRAVTAAKMARAVAASVASRKLVNCTRT